jgi:hypothetical protein
MEEITVKVPKGLPGPRLKKRIEDLVREEELRWSLFEKCKEELSLSKRTWGNLKEQGRRHGARPGRNTICNQCQRTLVRLQFAKLNYSLIFASF